MSEPSIVTEAKPVHPAVKLGVILHALFILSFALPKPPPIDARKLDPSIPADIRARIPEGRGSDYLLIYNQKFFKEGFVGDYCNATGIWQYWDLFAPNPSNDDFYIDALVTYRDGKKAIFPYPRMATSSILSRYALERYRKFTERFASPSYSYLWEPGAKKIARDMESDPSNPVTQVEMRRHGRYIPLFAETYPPRETTTYYTWSAGR